MTRARKREVLPSQNREQTTDRHGANLTSSDFEEIVRSPPVEESLTSGAANVHAMVIGAQERDNEIVVFPTLIFAWPSACAVSQRCGCVLQD